MGRVISSIITSIFFAVFVGVSLAYCTMDTPFQHHETMPLLWPIIFAGHFYGLLVSLVFYFIRRWHGDLEKLRGLTITSLVFLICVGPLFFLQMLFEPAIQNLIYEYAFVLFTQLAVIGVVCTHFLRNKNYNPKKVNSV
ncbi:MAG: hypothetical protein H7A32_04660 [Deltaproteobacteria bacterium]|nr:hypothetical protein [Deltaproteobacteria bacterium]